MLKRILEEVRDKHGECGIRKCRRKRKYLEGKGRGMLGNTLEKGPRPGMLKRIFERSAGQTGNRRKCWMKSKYGNVERDTSKKQSLTEK